MPENQSDVGAEKHETSSNQTETISDEVTNAVNQLPDSQQAGLPGIEELLLQLQAAVTASDQLPPDQKAEALEQVKVLAEAGKSPQSQLQRGAAKTAIAQLGGMIAEISGVPTVVGTWERISPELREIFGVE